MLAVSSFLVPSRFRAVRSRRKMISVLRESGHHRLDVLAALLADPLAEVDTLQVLHNRVPSEKIEIRYIHQIFWTTYTHHTFAAGPKKSRSMHRVQA